MELAPSSPERNDIAISDYFGCLRNSKISFHLGLDHFHADFKIIKFLFLFLLLLFGNGCSF